MPVSMLRLIGFAPFLLPVAFASAQSTPPSAPDSQASERRQPDSPNRAATTQVEVLSDTRGVNFGPYIRAVISAIRKNWYGRIPAKVLPPARQKGKVAIEFAIAQSGKLDDIAIDTASGDRELDQAAWDSISNSNPLPPLPAEFPAKSIKLRIYFYYNPSPDEAFPGGRADALRMPSGPRPRVLELAKRR